MQNTLLLDAQPIADAAPNVLRNVAHWHQQQSARVNDERSRRRHRATRFTIMQQLGAR